MTPERAAELAAMTTQCNVQGDALITVQQAILQACAEQREEIANELDHGMSDEQGHHRQYATAIREGK